MNSKTTHLLSVIGFTLFCSAPNAATLMSGAHISVAHNPAGMKVTPGSISSFELKGRVINSLLQPVERKNKVAQTDFAYSIDSVDSAPYKVTFNNAKDGEWTDPVYYGTLSAPADSPATISGCYMQFRINPKSNDFEFATLGFGYNSNADRTYCDVQGTMVRIYS